MKILTGFSSYSNLFRTLFFGLAVLYPFVFTHAQSSSLNDRQEAATTPLASDPFELEYSLRFQPDTTEMAINPENYPAPKSVLYKSLIIPGWGQIVNKQAWKVPLVYGLLGGLGWYSVYLTKQYHDYRAAYYNEVSGNGDLRFGPTPGYIPDSATPEALRNARDQLRNRRDFVYIGIFLAYGLNAVDAYVFAHMRTFDVSEDLSVRTNVRPTLLTNQAAPGVTFSFQLFNRSKTKY